MSHQKKNIDEIFINVNAP